uniref:S8 family serine peptidase n=1 Tax=Pseudoalteromonas sp. TaxID=53249 RepID=UPI00356180D6
MANLAKNGLFAVSLCALSVSSALYATSNTAVHIGNKTITLNNEKKVATQILSLQDKQGNVIKTKRHLIANNRYLVELSSPSLINTKSELKKQSRLSKQGSTAQAQSVKLQLDFAQTQIAVQQQQVTSQLSALSSDIRVLNKLTKTSNLLVIESDSNHIEAIKNLPNVKRVTPDRIKSIDLSESVDLISAPLVWAMQDANSKEITGKGVTVAILDTGIDYTHPDLGSCFGENCRVIAGYDFHNDDNDPMDGDGHGTHVAGIVGANGTLKGVAPDVTFHAYKVLSDEGWGYSSNIIAAIERAVDPDGDINTDDAVDIINMSLGGGGNASDPTSIATNNAVDAGVIVVVAAGNDGYYGAINNSSPASAEKAITVASSTKADDLSYFSSKSLTTTEFTKPEITAPGSQINSTLPNQAYGSLSGTSMASPHVAGAVALLKQHNPNLTAELSKQYLAAGAVNLDYDPLAQGPGRMDIEKSIKTTITANKTALNFGIIAQEQSSYSNTQTLTLFNRSKTEKTFSVNINDNLPAAAVMTASETSFTIPANSSHTIELILNVENVHALDFAENEGGILHNLVTISTESQSISVPAYVEHTRKLTLTTNAPSSATAIISYYGSFIWAEIFPNKATTLNINSENVTIDVSYFGIKPADLGLTDTNSFVLGSSSHKLSVSSSHQTIHFDIANLTNISKLESATDPKIGDVKDKLLPRAADTVILSEFSSFGAGYYGLTSQPIFAVGEIADTSKIHISSQYDYLDPNDTHEEKSEFLYEYTFDANNFTGQEISVDFGKLTPTTIALPTFSEATHYSLSKRLSGVSSDLDPNIKSWKIYEPLAYNHDYKKLSLHKVKFDPFQDIKLAETVFFEQNEQGALVTSVNTYTPIAMFTDQEKTISLTEQNVYFTGYLEWNDTDVTIFYNNPWQEGAFLFKDIQNNKYAKAFNYQFTCKTDTGSSLLSEGTISIDSNLTITKPDTQCDNTHLVLNYSTADNGQHVSSVSIPINGQSFISPIDSLTLVHQGGHYAKPIVNKIDSQLKIASSWWMDLSKVELRLNNGSWSPVNYELNNSEAIISLELIEGNHTADLRITTGSNTVYTYTSIFKFGASSGSDNDADNDGIPNDQDHDDDNDGYNDDVDAFPYNSKEWLDSDSDGTGDNADTDDDNDGYLDTEDAFPLDPNEWLDTDGDGIGNNTDTDDDGDGHLDEEDAFPLDPREWIDTDADGIGNNADTDDDNDGVLDTDDAFPLDATESVDTDGDGIGNNADTDDDNDGVSDTEDAFPLDATESVDTDGDGIGN